MIKVLGATAGLVLLAACGSTAAPASTSTPAASATQKTATPKVTPKGSATPHRSAPPPPAAAGQIGRVHDPKQVTGVIHGPCHVEGKLPDPHCTPGAFDPQITKSVLCAPGYTTKSYRPPASDTNAFKVQAYIAYGIPYSTRSELDHLIPLELGGSNSSDNLWPEVGAIPNPKDKVEGVLHDAVCSGKATLFAAQVAIASNWTTAERALGISGT